MTVAAAVPVSLVWKSENECRKGDELFSFVMSSWLKSNRETGGFCSLVPKEVYWDAQTELIQRLIRKHGIWLSHIPDDETMFMGFGCGGGVIVHYLYVKHAWRRANVAAVIAQKMLGSDRKGVQHTHVPKNEEVRKNLIRRGWVYNPYSLLL